MSEDEDREYSVIVGNVGTTLTTESYNKALREYEHYKTVGQGKAHPRPSHRRCQHDVVQLSGLVEAADIFGVRDKGGHSDGVAAPLPNRYERGGNGGRGSPDGRGVPDGSHRVDLRE